MIIYNRRESASETQLTAKRNSASCGSKSACGKVASAAKAARGRIHSRNEGKKRHFGDDSSCGIRHRCAIRDRCKLNVQKGASLSHWARPARFSDCPLFDAKTTARNSRAFLSDPCDAN